MRLDLLKAPFPYFGGKSAVARDVWNRFGKVRNYVEPFFGSGAMLLGRPHPFEGTETVNDIDGMVANFWRAVQVAPDDVAFFADWPVNENDLHARHVWLVGQKESLQSRLDGDFEFYDARIAGWWCWGMCCWIGSGFCSGNGPWQSVEVDGVRQLVHLGNSGQGVSRQRVHLGDSGRGVNRKLVHLGNGQVQESEKATPGRESTASESTLATGGIYDWMNALSERLKRVRVCSGDWSRVCGPTPTVTQGLTAVFLDPPYADTAGRAEDLYAHDCLDVAHKVREWAVANGDDKRLRIALCGYEGEHELPAGWECFEWKARGGYGSQGDDEESAGRANAKKERIWFSPHCLKRERHKQGGLF